ncbi:response regulator transcription factor [Leucobacter sp. M11]|uniref:response regulator transcription factor n=1 Tax=Leucobacter sp. M11 TaxID=2993565 RepID=UPI002D801350|nr:response regulator transcription factor [Leucobacter sp. M11]MEB4616078.1 response regulator transcription factor [Leucobacter sp. M11]
MTARAPEDITVLLVDDQLLLRQTLALLIDSTEGMRIVGEAADGVEAIALAQQTTPDVIVMDVRMPKLDGLQATRTICADPALTSTRILMLSMFELDEYVHQALRAGASGFILKDSPPHDLISAISRTHDGETLFAPVILTRLIERYLDTPRATTTPEPSRSSTLTARETQVLGLVGRGMSNPQIAEHLTISVRTVKSHIANLLHKLDARDRTHLVIAAYDHGLVTPRT